MESSVDFIQRAFPDLSAAAVRRHLASANGNVELAIQEILLIAEEGLPPTGSADGLDFLDPIEILASAFPALSLQSLRESLKESNGDLSECMERLRDPGPRSGEGRLASLQAIFPHRRREDVEEALEECGGDVDKAADVLLNPTGLQAVSRSAVGRDQDVELLIEMFGGTEVEMKRLLRIHGGLHKTITYLSGPVKSTPAKAVPAPYNAVASPSSTSHKARKYPLDIVMKNSPAAESLPTPTSASPRATTVAERWLDASYCRKRAANHLKSRNEAFTLAATHFQRGNLTGRGSAQYYSDVGREETKAMELWNERAAQAVVRQNGQLHKDDDVVDLHGLTRREALERIDEAVNGWYNSCGANAKPKRPLKVIAGSGTHSPKNKPVLLPTVMKHLKNAGWKIMFEPGNGWFFVTG
ncbi:hypothetical protein HK101_007268 [Irineochytrium annulatum]|nr:hypothetical protein HK101_007268 [Irineochytrium annulatum]